jgi:RHS repeat-associated protein
VANVIAEADDSGDTQREYIWLEGRPVAVVADVATAPEILQVHTDHLDRPIMMTDESRAVVWRATYLPYGEVFAITGAAALDYRFPGQWFQRESGLAYNWHRHYDPSAGRYLQPDPLGLAAGISRWAYVANSPLMNVDPTGLAFVGLSTSALVGSKPVCGPSAPPPWLPIIPIASRESQDKQFRDAMRNIAETIGRPVTRAERQMLHREISGQDLGFHEIVEIGIELLGRNR